MVAKFYNAKYIYSDLHPECINMRIDEKGNTWVVSATTAYRSDMYLNYSHVDFADIKRKLPHYGAFIKDL